MRRETQDIYLEYFEYVMTSQKWFWFDDIILNKNSQLPMMYYIFNKLFLPVNLPFILYLQLF